MLEHFQDLAPARWRRGGKGTETPYVYRELSKNNDQIRVLKLLSGTWNDRIRIELTTHSFTERNSPYYGALSYTWGSSQDKATIYVAHGRAWRTVQVSRSCEEALKHIRGLASNHLYLWVDAICINQADLAERARQVTIMAKIYGQAATVVAWVGPASHDSHIAIDWIRKTASKLGVEATKEASVALDSPWYLFEPNGTTVDINFLQFQALANFTERSWFERLWIWQEIKTGRGNAILMCGSVTLPWTKFRTAMRHCAGKVMRGQIPQFANRLPLLDALCEAPEFGFFNALIAMKDSKCTDQRDRVYTAQTFCAPRESAAMIHPDYTMSVEEVYTLSTMRYALECKLLTFLLHVNSPKTLSNLPSWVPDWSADRPHASWPSSCQADSFAKAEVKQQDHATIIVVGQRVATVRAVTPYTISNAQSLEHKLEALRKVLSASVPTGESPDIERFVQLLSSGNNPDRWEPPDPALPSLSQWRSYIQFLFTEGDSKESYFPVLMTSQLLANRAVLQCDNGYLAIGSVAVEEGDVVAVILGCHMPLVLRDMGHGKFQLIGPAFCEGLGDGQALLGPLPADFEMIHVHDTRKEYVPAFRNRETGQTQWGDPRLPQLPSEWETDVQYEGRNPPFYVHRKTGEPRYYLEDPRCDAEALMSRGIKLESFTLI